MYDVIKQTGNQHKSNKHEIEHSDPYITYKAYHKFCDNGLDSMLSIHAINKTVVTVWT